MILFIRVVSFKNRLVSNIIHYKNKILQGKIFLFLQKKQASWKDIIGATQVQK